MNLNQPKIAALIEFGLGGHRIEYAPRAGYGQCSCSGYESPESFERREASCNDPENIPDGIPVIDKRAVLEQRPGLAWSEPMVDTGLAPSQVDACPSPSSLMAAAMVGSPGNQFGAMLVGHRAAKGSNPNEPGPLDSIAVIDSVNRWRSHGAQIGHWCQGRIVWESKGTRS